MRIHQETGLPVHYVAVAERLEVSKWTAYDMLRQLEKSGYLEVEYAVAGSYAGSCPGALQACGQGLSIARRGAGGKERNLGQHQKQVSGNL